MAITAIRGYESARAAHLFRRQNGLSWNGETMGYEKSAEPVRDRFMELRLRKMQKIAMNMRVILKATRTFAPNRKAALKARQTIAQYDRVLGRQSLTDHLKSAVLVASGAVESARLAWHRSRGQECIVRQPPSKLKHYPEDPSLRRSAAAASVSVSGHTFRACAEGQGAADLVRDIPQAPLRPTLVAPAQSAGETRPGTSR